MKYINVRFVSVFMLWFALCESAAAQRITSFSTSKPEHRDYSKIIPSKADPLYRSICLSDPKTYLNVRFAPSKSAATIGKLFDGDTISATELFSTIDRTKTPALKTNWVLVAKNNDSRQSGWIDERFVCWHEVDGMPAPPELPD
jgi:hypothetical protein